MEGPIKESKDEKFIISGSENEKNPEKDYITKEEFNYSKKQWKYKTAVWIVIFVAVAVVLTCSITYYVTVDKKYDDLYDSISSITITSGDDSEEESVESSELITEISTVLSSFAEVIDANYIGDIDKEELIDSTVKGFVEGIGDEYSEYMTAEEWEDYQASALGNYVGVGIYMTTDDNGNVVVVSTISETPAEEAGIKSEDIITAVDGVSTADMTVTEVSTAVKGEEGTEVTLTIYRNGESLDFTMERKSIKIYHVETEMIDDETGYISLLTFDTGCAEEFEEGMDELIDQGATKIILDLRYNTGGLVTEALDILDLFVDKGTITLIEEDSSGNRIVNTSSDDKKYDVEMVVLVNEYTASASEIVTAALKDNGIATIVGTTTYGKGVIQNVYQLSDGSVLKLTTAEYFTPNGDTINKVGIEPDYEIEYEETEETSSDDTDGIVIDNQIQKAIELLGE